MKRIVILIDGTWNKEGLSGNTNVAKLDSARKIAAFIRPEVNGVQQIAHYHSGVGSEGNWLIRVLGGAIGLGLKEIIREVYEFIAARYSAGDEIYLLGFSRGAYAARALAGLIGASGIQRHKNGDVFELAWQHYRIKPEARRDPKKASTSEKNTVAEYERALRFQVFHNERTIKCVAVWDTVGSYGIPAGFGLAPLARYISLLRLGFHDTRFGDHIQVGLHAVAIDEHRRPFVPTFWTIPRGQQPRGHVEQTWFAGAHANIGGGYQDGGLSDHALIWMIARLEALTGLAFDMDAVRANTKPDVRGAVVDSTKGWLLDQFFPRYRTILSPVAIHHGYFFNTKDPSEERMNERVHWTVREKREATPRAYAPSNLPDPIPWNKIATITEEERTLLRLLPVGERV